MKPVKSGSSILLISVILAGCGGDPAPAPDQSALAVGAWQNTRHVRTGCTDPGNNENTTCSSGCEILVIATNAFTIMGDRQYECAIGGNSLTVEFDPGPEVIGFTISGTELTLTRQATPALGGCKTIRTYKKYDNKVTDADGNVYNTIFIGTQEWMKENLKTTHYSNGDEIQNITDASAWVNAYSSAYSDYDNSADNAQVYGKLYNQYAVKDIRNVCPAGWHVPDLNEWNTLFNTLGGGLVAGGKMKSTSDLWNSPNEGASNESGFSGLPAGARLDAGEFIDLHDIGHWWSWDAANIQLHNDKAGVPVFNNNNWSNGSSVRCIRD